MYETLLALHLLSAAIAFITIVIFSAWAFGAPVRRPEFVLADLAWNVSGAGLLVFGVWLALYVDGYELWDGWILGAIGVFALTAVSGTQARTRALAVVDGASSSARDITLWHWVRTLSVVAILVLMVWKPGA